MQPSKCKFKNSNLIYEYVKAKNDYTAKQADELSFKKGDLMKIVNRGSQVPGWWIGSLDGKEGLFNVQMAEYAIVKKDSDNEYVLANSNYEAKRPEELSFRKGDQIEIANKTSPYEGFWVGTINGQVGLFPISYVNYADIRKHSDGQSNGDRNLRAEPDSASLKSSGRAGAFSAILNLIENEVAPALHCNKPDATSQQRDANNANPDQLFEEIKSDLEKICETSTESFKRYNQRIAALKELVEHQQTLLHNLTCNVKHELTELNETGQKLNADIDKLRTQITDYKQQQEQQQQKLKEQQKQEQQKEQQKQN